MTFKKKKGGSYVVTWDSDASSSDDDDSYCNNPKIHTPKIPTEKFLFKNLCIVK